MSKREAICSIHVGRRSTNVINWPICHLLEGAFGFHSGQSSITNRAARTVTQLNILGRNGSLKLKAWSCFAFVRFKESLIAIDVHVATNEETNSTPLK